MQGGNNHWTNDSALPELTQLLVSIAELQDPSAEKHATGVADLVTRLGEQINMDHDELMTLKYAGMLHDVGKVAISESVISKPTRLTRAEYLMVQQHTSLGYKLLVPLQIPSVITEAILSHHENYDGKGYPEGLKGESIPLSARIVRIVDYYDALTSYRSYRPKAIYRPADALQILQENRHCFDLSLLEVFVHLIETQA